MQPNQKLEIQIDRALFRKSYPEFFRAAWKEIDTDELVMSWYITYICNRLQDAIERVINGEKRIKHIAISLPPRTAKSSIVSKQLLPWAWTKAPWLKFITATYGDRLSEELSIASKTLIETEWYQNRFGHVFSFSDKKNTNAYYLNDKGGWRLAVAAGIPISGTGGNILIGDDLLDPFLAYSEAERNMIIRWFRTVFTRRLNRKEIDLIILLQQRAHINDPIGFVEKHLPDQFEIISIPAEIGFNDVCPSPKELEQFYTDNLMDPIRFPRAVLEYEKDVMLEQDYDAQYLQSPKKLGGNIIQKKYFPEYNVSEILNEAKQAGVKLITNFTGDTAYTKDQANSATVFIGAFKYNDKLYLVNRLKVWEEITELVSYEVDNRRKEGSLERFVRSNGYTNESEISIEPKASGLDIIATVRKFTGLNVTSYELKDTDKLTAARSVLPLIKAGKILLPAGADWLEDFYDSVEAFNGQGKGSDDVDALVMQIKLYLLSAMNTDENKVFQYTELKEFPKDAPGNTWIGVNFGYSNNETSVVKVMRDETNKKLYIHELSCKEGMDVTDVIFKMNAWKISKSIPIVCNSLEKKSIAEFKNSGFNVFPVQLGKEGEYLSITTLTGYELNITTSSENLLKEMSIYTWEIDSASGKGTNKALGKSQSITALRLVSLYALGNNFKAFRPIRLGRTG